jgi:hypothetical protein
MRKEALRVYEKIEGTGMVKEAPFVSVDGDIRPYPISKNGKNPRKLAEAKAFNFPIITTKQCEKMAYNMSNGLPPAVGMQEDPQGQLSTYRAEKPAVQGVRKILRFEINNTENTTETVVIGDYTGEVKRKLGVSAPKSGVLITGTYGSDTYTQIQTITGVLPMRLHGIQFQNKTSLGADSTGFFDSGRFGICFADPVGQTLINDEYPLSDLITQSTFQTYIREAKGFRFILGAPTAYAVTIPAGEKLLVTSTVQSVGLTVNMDMLSFNSVYQPK